MIGFYVFLIYIGGHGILIGLVALLEIKKRRNRTKITYAKEIKPIDIHTKSGII